MKIAVVGAGASGLAVLRQLGVDNEDKFEVICFEQLSEVGGLWNYCDVITDDNHPTGSNYTAVYKSLKTNLPRQIMAFIDFPFPKNLPTFIGHEDVSKYLHNYCDRFNLGRFIQFNKRVTRIKPHSIIINEDVWNVSVLDILTKEITEYIFDAVVICNGHFFEPLYPKIKGLNRFKGSLLHSQVYKDPENFKHKKVLVIGGGPSGIDIASEICEVADKTWISHRKTKLLPLSDKIEQIGEVLYCKESTIFASQKTFGENKKEQLTKVENNDFKLKLSIDESNNLSGSYNSQLNNNSNFTLCIDEVDVIICCTGFSYSYPFLCSDCGVAVIYPLHIGPLYKDMICVGRPTLSFIGIPSQILPFPFIECQAKFLKAFLLERTLVPKSGSELSEKINKDNEIKKLYGVDLLEDPHRICGLQWAYMKELASLGKFDPPPSYYEALYNEVRKQRILSMDYKNKEYKINEDGSFEELIIT